MDNRYKKVLITGGGRRLGSIVAKNLAKEGYSVFIHYYNSHLEAKETEKTIKNDGGEVFLLRKKLNNYSDCKILIDEFFSKHSKNNYENFVLINNASSFEHDTSESFTEEKLDLHLNVNFKIPTFLIKHFVINLPSDKSGSVINMLDAKLFGLNSDHYTYTLSKFSLMGLTKVSALSYAPKIRVNGIAPGFTLSNENQTEEDFERIRKMTLLGNNAYPEEIVEATKFLINTKSITGETILIDGGSHLNPQKRDAAFL